MSYINASKVRQSLINFPKIRELDTHKIGEIGAFVVSVELHKADKTKYSYAPAKLINGGDANCEIVKIAAKENNGRFSDIVSVRIGNIDTPFAIKRLGETEEKSLAFKFEIGKGIRRVN